LRHLLQGLLELGLERCDLGLLEVYSFSLFLVIGLKLPVLSIPVFLHCSVDQACSLAVVELLIVVVLVVIRLVSGIKLDTFEGRHLIIVIIL
jgi:uncharacterized membrane protein (DUF485 family)